MNTMVRNPNKQSGEKAVTTEEVIRIACRAAGEKKASEILLLDLRKVATFTDFFLICSGSSTRQVQAISDSVEEQLRLVGRRPLHTEGYSRAEWILLDYGDLVVHVFSIAARRFYDLERLWRDAERLELPEPV
jgi:ribosome-associated protein